MRYTRSLFTFTYLRTSGIELIRQLHSRFGCDLTCLCLTNWYASLRMFCRIGRTLNILVASYTQNAAIVCQLDA